MFLEKRFKRQNLADFYQRGQETIDKFSLLAQKNFALEGKNQAELKEIGSSLGLALSEQSTIAEMQKTICEEWLSRFTW